MSATKILRDQLLAVFLIVPAADRARRGSCSPRIVLAAVWGATQRVA